MYEKRRDYTRTVWFDIQGRPHGEGLDLLRSWGLEQELTDPDEIHRFAEFDPRELDLVVVRCNALERFLYRYATKVGVEFRYEEFESLDALPDFDVIIGADGVHSKVRRALAIDMQWWNISQKSLVVDFPACPRGSPTWGRADYIRPGVSLVGMRWFGSFCNMQILLTDSVSRNLKNDEIPWDLLLDVSNVVLDRQSMGFDTVEGLKRATRNAQVLEESVRRAATGTVLLKGNRAGILIGDAVASAYYRLGIGVNNALNAQRHLTHFLNLLRNSPRKEWPAIIKQKAHVDSLRLHRVARYQSQVMWLHTVCEQVVFFQPPPPIDEYSFAYDVLEYPRSYDRTPTFDVYRYDHTSRIRVLPGMTTAEALKYCQEEKGVSREFGGPLL